MSIALDETAAFNRGVSQLLDLLLPQRVEDVLNFRPTPDLQARIEELADKCTEDELTAEERAEYEGYVRANNFVAILQRQARRRSSNGHE